MDYTGILRQLTSFPAVTGYEKGFSLFIKGLFEKYCDTVEVDSFSNVTGIKRGQGKSNKKIMITAHLDEIGFIVKSIDERGFIKFSNMGGIDSRILLAQEVVVHGRRNVMGVIGAKPPHLLRAGDARKAVKLDDLSIDTGMDEKSVKECISIGDVITFKGSSIQLQGNKMSSKALDNRAGIAAMLKAMEELSKYKLGVDIYYVATVQEEFMLTGAIAASYSISPDAAVVIDACHGDMPETRRDEVHPLGKGPAVGIGPTLHKGMARKLIDIAKEMNIACQIDVEPEDTGTETWATQVSRYGIPTSLVSIPVRYMHTAVETLNTEDVKNTGRLVAEFLKRDDELEEILC